MMIVIDDSRVINKLEASLTDDARIVIYDRHMFIVQATGLLRIEEPSYCEQSKNETSVQVQSVYFNDNLSSNHQRIYVKSEQIKWKGE